MILGQLIQAGRRFCECRSKDFIPESEDTIVVVAYSIHGKFLAHSFDTDLGNLRAAIKTWLFSLDPVGYLLIQKESHGSQQEFSAPIGRSPMDRLTLTAATHQDFKTEAYYLAEVSSLDTYRLLPTSCVHKRPATHSDNFFQIESSPNDSLSNAYFPEFAELAN